MVERIVLENGARLLLERIPEVRSASLGLWVATGSRDEAEDEAGFAHFVEHMMFKGTKRRTARDIATAFDRLGGQVNAMTTKEYTAYYAKVLDRFVFDAFRLLYEMLTESVYAPEEIEKEKNVILEEMSMVEDTPDDVVHDLAAQVVYGDHPLGRPVLGRPEAVAGLSREALLDFVDRTYTPERLIVTVAGRFADDTVDAIRAAVGALPPQSGASEANPGAAMTDARRMNARARFAAHRAVRDEDGRACASPPAYVGGELRKTREDLEQAHVVYVYPGLAYDHADIFAMAVLNNIVGGSMSSRLFQTVREDEGLVYNIYSYHTAHRDSGYFAVYAGMRPENAVRVYEHVIKELARLARGEIRAEELEAAKMQLVAGTLFALESTGARMSRMARNELYLGRHPGIDDVQRWIEAVTVDDVVRLATALFHRPLGTARIEPPLSAERPSGKP
ncbi:MAG: insulinase family protein [Hydrogenibacillus sp.]|nr:insulinase family protein [Hydrogenibacillus sp.]